jgi:hypothetical protein
MHLVTLFLLSVSEFSLECLSFLLPQESKKNTLDEGSCIGGLRSWCTGRNGEPWSLIHTSNQDLCHPRQVTTLVAAQSHPCFLADFHDWHSSSHQRQIPLESAQQGVEASSADPVTVAKRCLHALDSVGQQSVSRLNRPLAVTQQTERYRACEQPAGLANVNARKPKVTGLPQSNNGSGWSWKAAGAQDRRLWLCAGCKAYMCEGLTGCYCCRLCKEGHLAR